MVNFKRKPQEVLDWDNNIVTKELLFHFVSKVRLGAQIYNYEYWFTEIFINSVKNLLPNLEVYPVNFNDTLKKIERNIAVGYGLNEWELEILKYDILESFKTDQSKNFKICWEIEKKHDIYSYYIVGIKFTHPVESKLLSLYYEFCLKSKSSDNKFTINKTIYKNLVEQIKIIFIKSVNLYS